MMGHLYTLLFSVLLALAKGHMWTRRMCSCTPDCADNSRWEGSRTNRTPPNKAPAARYHPQYVKLEEWGGANLRCKGFKKSPENVATFTTTKLCGIVTNLVEHGMDITQSSTCVVKFRQHGIELPDATTNEQSDCLSQYSVKSEVKGWSWSNPSNPSASQGEFQVSLELSADICSRCKEGQLLPHQSCNIELRRLFTDPGRSAGSVETYSDCFDFRIAANVDCGNLAQSKLTV